jgi:hypothetical protein
MIGVERFLDSDGRLKVWPGKQQDKQLVCEYLATKFVVGQSYSEAGVNDLLKAWHTFSDWPLLRRELYERHLLDRNADGSDYCRPGAII